MLGSERKFQSTKECHNWTQYAKVTKDPIFFWVDIVVSFLQHIDLFWRRTLSDDGDCR